MLYIINYIYDFISIGTVFALYPMKAILKATSVLDCTNFHYICQ